MDESHFEHPGVVLGGFLESREDTSAFFQPSDQAFDDVSFAIGFLIKGHTAIVPVVAVFGRDNRLNVEFQEKIVNPIGSVSFVAGQGNRPCDRLALAIGNFRIRTIQ